MPTYKIHMSRNRSEDKWVGHDLMGNSALYKGDYKVLLLGTWLENLAVQGAQGRGSYTT